jgi:WD40 repeat protein
LAITSDGKRIVSTSADGSIRVWPLDNRSGERSRVLFQDEGAFAVPDWLTVAPDGSFVITGNLLGQVTVRPLDGGPARELVGFTDIIKSVAVGPRSRLVAAGSGSYIREEAIVRVWDLESGEVRILDAGDGEEIYGLLFSGAGSLWVASGTKLRRWRLDGDRPSVVVEMDLSVPDGTEVFFDDLSQDSRLVLLGANDGRLWTQDLITGETHELTAHAERWSWAIFDTHNEIVVSVDEKGGIRVGPVTGEEAHLLQGTERKIRAVAISPDSRWIATGGGDAAIHLWPMPDLTRPPLHTLPREELIAKLKTLTNLRAVRDETSSTGWKIELGPFPGWETVPTW